MYVHPSEYLWELHELSQSSQEFHEIDTITMIHSLQMRKLRSEKLIVFPKVTKLVLEEAEL